MNKQDELFQKAIDNPNVNVFDIVNEGKHFDVYTYRKPLESQNDYEKRDFKNLQFAKRLKTRNPS